MAGWSDFDHLLPIEKVERSRQTRDAGTGLPIAPTINVTSITGNVEYAPLADEGRVAGGLVTEGDCILYTETSLAAGDRVRIHTDGAGTYREWRVKGPEDDYNWMHQNTSIRIGYVLEAESDG